MEEQSNATNSRYFNQHQNQYPATYVAYPSTSSYPYLQQSYTQQQQYGNSYSQALTDYAANQCYQQYQQGPLSIKSQSNLKWNTKRKTPYSKAPGSGISQQLYCEICKVSCAGEQSYKDHCDGQKHKKKELILNNSSTSAPKAKPRSSFFCELCQVPCSGVDSFNAHLNGKSHIKVCNLQVKMGKEVPADLVPPILKPANQNQAAAAQPADESPSIKVIGTPVINFVKGECLNTMADGETAKEDASAVENDEAASQAIENGEQPTDGNEPADESAPENSAVDDSAADEQPDANDNLIPFIDDQDNAANQSNAEPVGLEFVIEYNQPNSKATFFSCTLCNCKFSEFTAKEQHVRGKRHLKAFKMKSKNIRQANLNQTAPAAPMASMPMVSMPMAGLPMASMPMASMPMVSSVVNAAPFGGPMLSTPNTRRPPSFENLLPASARSNKKLKTNETPLYSAGQAEQPAEQSGEFQENIDIRSFIECDFYETPHTTHDNRYLLRKHAEIVPREDDLKLFYKHLGNVERSLKLVSDDFLRDVNELRETLNLPVAQGGRILQGEIRAGLFGKKLLLREERQIDLILFCAVKPNVPLLKRAAEVLADKLDKIEDEKYKVKENIEMAAIDVHASNVTIRITLTSLYFRDMNVPTSQNGEERYKDPEQMLNKQRCLDALTALRRFKWYLAKVGPFQPCPMLIRLLKDLTKRVPAWKPLTCWALELICERVLSNCTTQPTPAEGFKFILRTLASGALLSDSYDAILIQDPCEYEKVDALSYLTEQQRKELTDSAQDFVGLIAFDKMYQVLGVERISSPAKQAAPETASNGNEETGSCETKSNYGIGETAEAGASQEPPEEETTSNGAAHQNDKKR